MQRSLLLAAPIAAMLAFASAGGVAAAPLAAPDRSGVGSLAETVQYRFYCRRWRHECARRWGFGGWRYRRCLTIRGCL